MKRWWTIGFLTAALVALTIAPALGQEEGHYEGYFINSTTPAVNPHPAVIGVEGWGLITALYPPLVFNFSTNEYTWVAKGLLPSIPVTTGTSTRTTFAANWGTFVIYEDPLGDARPTFYLCPSDITSSPPGDPRYTNGTVYLKGHFTSFTTTYDSASQLGTFQGQLNWDSGSHIADIPATMRGAWTFGGTTSATYACVPTASGFDQGMTGRIFQAVTPTKANTWGEIRRLYK